MEPLNKTINVVDTLIATKPINSERQMYPWMQRWFKLMKIYMLQKKGIPDYIMIEDNWLDNGFMECKIVDKISKFNMEKSLSRPQQILLDIFLRSGYKYYIAICEKGGHDVVIYEVEMENKESKNANNHKLRPKQKTV